MCQYRSLDEVSLRFRLSKAELMRICRIWKKRLDQAEETLARITAMFTDMAPVGSPTGSILGDMPWYMEHALNTLEGRSVSDGYTHKFLNSQEFQDSKKRTNYGWVFQILSVMDESLRLSYFKETGRRFHEICTATLKRRARLSAKYLEKKRKGEVLEQIGKRTYGSTELDRLPVPNIIPATVAEHLSCSARAEAVLAMSA
jgi:hypothetical protein